MESKDKLFKYCLINLCILLIAIILIIIFRDDDSKYLRVGPQKDLIIISVHIDNWMSYFIFSLIVIPLKIVGCLLDVFGNSTITLNVYNPDIKKIANFTKNEFQFYANSMYMINNLREILLILITITQVDLALIIALTGEIMRIFTIRIMLCEKEFKLNCKHVSLIDNQHEMVPNGFHFIPDPVIYDSDIEEGVL